MTSAAHDPLETEWIWICGKPTFLRQAMSVALREIFGLTRVHEVTDLEPPALHVPGTAQWMIWFLNFKYRANVALVELPPVPTPLNLVIIEGDGRVLLRRADRGELEPLELSLQELVRLLKFSRDSDSPESPS